MHCWLKHREAFEAVLCDIELWKRATRYWVDVVSLCLMIASFMYWSLLHITVDQTYLAFATNTHTHAHCLHSLVIVRKHQTPFSDYLKNSLGAKLLPVSGIKGSLRLSVKYLLFTDRWVAGVIDGSNKSGNSGLWCLVQMHLKKVCVACWRKNLQRLRVKNFLFHYHGVNQELSECAACAIQLKSI